MDQTQKTIPQGGEWRQKTIPQGGVRRLTLKLTMILWSDERILS
uniref:Uncharacterized protein n=1 Tax=Arundo donax TaxID=35708 RepID=A0A0A8Y9D3_ARUDO